MSSLKHLIFLCLLLPLGVLAQSENSNLEDFQWNIGGTISPQMLFVGALDLGIYTNVEWHPMSNQLALLGGLDLRNKWLQLPASNGGLDTKSLKTHYSFSGLSYLGVGFSFRSNEQERNSFYFNVSPTLFSFKESVANEFINNTVKSNTLSVHSGITWTNTKVNKKGKKINTQLYIPIFGSHFLDQIRFMNFKLGIAF